MKFAMLNNAMAIVPRNDNAIAASCINAPLLTLAPPPEELS
eukprot:CAMPEP_0201616138 /NCGR_PEP_ID=MMETSP0492-20130828/33128_1 /ASSEMBLY_ACC=CAM_ASM_000837 /TAXON_ID=420259 /ORGANISM="Thalassiosira gravida, Strain GMp14c1" /LENGTH=40 /DNA_ID= /DNA_START= /DNA_END= /DNA_ORIENTATION=